MTRHDGYDTPAEIAKALVRCVSREDIAAVADFAAGGGALLHAARLRWPNANILASDSDRSCVRLLRETYPEWVVSCVDFLNERSRTASAVFRSTKDVPLILLNPPFTCRGARTEQVSFGATEVNCSVALAFVLTAISYLAEDGQLVAILPQGSLRSSKDATGWALLRALFEIEVHQKLHCRAFSGAVVHTSVVSFRKRARTALKLTEHAARGRVGAAAPAVEIVRGKIQLHNAQLVRSGVPLVHTTELHDGRVQTTSRYVASLARLTIRGPAVLLPRVGAPRQHKIAVLPSGAEVALSDCVIALRCATVQHAEEVAALLRGDRWADVASLYGGTCARYVRVAVLQDWLAANGVRTEELALTLLPLSSDVLSDDKSSSPRFNAAAIRHRAGPTAQLRALRTTERSR